jgi:hypothetical protein
MVSYLTPKDNRPVCWLISRTFSANERCFSLTTNQRPVLSVMAFQLSEQGLALSLDMTSNTINYKGKEHFTPVSSLAPSTH